MRKNSRKPYIDRRDLSSSTSRLLIWQALKKYRVNALVPMLQDPELVVRTAVARELQLRGGAAVWALVKKLCKRRNVSDRVIGLFILGQLGTPRLPYQRESLALIDSMLRYERSPDVVEQALYATGHLRKGKPLGEHRLAQRIRDVRARRGSSLSEAKAFALRK
jgi:hypothetical protein